MSVLIAFVTKFVLTEFVGKLLILIGSVLAIRLAFAFLESPSQNTNKF